MNKSVRKYLLLLGLLFDTQQLVFAQSLDEQMVFSALALNIVRFTTWSTEAEAHMKESIGLCVLGNDVVQEAFASIEQKAVGDKTIKVINLSPLSNFEACHALYVSELEQTVLRQVLAKIKKRPLLTIGQSADFVQQGGMVGLENVDGKITLYVNLYVVRESNLNISARLLKLAKIYGE